MSTVRFDVQDGVAWLRLSRPDRKNAVSVQMLEDLLAVLPNLARDDIRALVLAGDGEAFCSGLDLAEAGDMFSWLAAEGDGHEDAVAVGVRRAQQVVTGIAELPYPTVAAVRGPAIGGGLELALACDLVLVADDAVLALPEVQWGLIPDWGGSQRLPRVIGLPRAKAMVLLGERLGAQQAVDIGLAYKKVSVGDLERVASDLASRWAAMSPTALREAKRLLDTALDNPIDDGLIREATAQSACSRSPEVRKLSTSTTRR